MAVIFLSGSDTYHARAWLREKQQPWVYLEAADYSRWQDIPGLRGEIGLFASDQFVVLINPIAQGSKELRDGLLEQLTTWQAQDNLQLILWEKGEPDKRSSLVKELQRLGIQKYFGAPTPSQQATFIRTQLLKSQVEVAPALLQSLQDGLQEFNLWKQGLELQKLALHARGEGRTTLNESDLALLDRDLQVEVWGLLQLAVYSKKDCLRLLRKLTLQGVAPQEIIGALTYRLRTIMDYHYRLRSLGYREQQDVQRLTQRIDARRILMLVQKLADLDLAAKMGRVDYEYALPTFLLFI